MTDEASHSKPTDTSEAPLDLSAYLNPERSESNAAADASTALVTTEPALPANVPPEVQAPMAPMARLVDLSSLFGRQRREIDEAGQGHSLRRCHIDLEFRR